jgi:hypothetical protein
VDEKEAFGVITIFKGSSKTSFIENDLITLGPTAFFTGQPDLRIIEHKHELPDADSILDQ